MFLDCGWMKWKFFMHSSSTYKAITHPRGYVGGGGDEWGTHNCLMILKSTATSTSRCYDSLYLVCATYEFMRLSIFLFGFEGWSGWMDLKITYINGFKWGICIAGAKIEVLIDTQLFQWLLKNWYMIVKGLFLLVCPLLWYIGSTPLGFLYYQDYFETWKLQLKNIVPPCISR